MAKKGPSSIFNRTTTVSVCLNPKIHYLASLAAREQQRSLSSFIEWAIRRALTEGAILQEPNYSGNHSMPAAPAPMWGEGLYDADPADRLFLLATGRPDLMTEAEAGFWKLSSGSIFARGDLLTLESYRKTYHHPDYNTAHLAETEEVQA